MSAPVSRNVNSADVVELTMLLNAVARPTRTKICPFLSFERQRPDFSHTRATNQASANAAAYASATETAPTK